MPGKCLAEPDDKLLVTGSSGFVGVKVVDCLLRYGFRSIRCLVRPSSRLDRLREVIEKQRAGEFVEIVTGDVLSREDCIKASANATVVYHLAAGFDKSFAGAFMNSALGTRNLMDAFLSHGSPKRFVNVSSFAVYSNMRLKRGALLDETAPLEESSQERYDAYAYGKLKQEQLVREYGKTRGLPYVILRPGTVFGPGKKDLTGRIGINTFGFFIHIGGKNRLPLTFVDNCAEAVVLAGLVPGVDGEAFNVVDSETMTSGEFLRAYRRHVKPFFSLRIPYPAAFGLCRAWEAYSQRTGGQLPPVFNRYRCAADWKGNQFSNAKIRCRLGWEPKISLRDGMNQFLAQFAEGSG